MRESDVVILLAGLQEVGTGLSQLWGHLSRRRVMAA